jgi:hypothetical protein
VNSTSRVKNMCYMNALAQALASSPQMAALIRGMDARGGGSEAAVVMELQNAMERLLCSNKRWVQHLALPLSAAPCSVQRPGPRLAPADDRSPCCVHAPSALPRHLPTPAPCPERSSPVNLDPLREALHVFDPSGPFKRGAESCPHTALAKLLQAAAARGAVVGGAWGTRGQGMVACGACRAPVHCAASAARVCVNITESDAPTFGVKEALRRGVPTPLEGADVAFCWNCGSAVVRCVGVAWGLGLSVGLGLAAICVPLPLSGGVPPRAPGSALHPTHPAGLAIAKKN